MEIKTLILRHIQTNCYLLSTESGAIVVDPGFVNEETERFLLENSDKERLILITHGHFDHISGALALREKTGVKIAIGRLDNEYLSDNALNLSCRFRTPVIPFSADILLDDLQEFLVGDINVKTILTPGHTKGGVCYLINDVIFSGDTIFFESIGRTDFPGGSYETLIDSINKLFSLPKDYALYPGHGEPTTLSHEKKYNPFIR